jgi:hypothetical protein
VGNLCIQVQEENQSPVGRVEPKKINPHQVFNLERVYVIIY